MLCSLSPCPADFPKVKLSLKTKTESGVVSIVWSNDCMVAKQAETTAKDLVFRFRGTYTKIRILHHYTTFLISLVPFTYQCSCMVCLAYVAPERMVMTCVGNIMLKAVSMYYDDAAMMSLLSYATGLELKLCETCYL